MIARILNWLRGVAIELGLLSPIVRGPGVFIPTPAVPAPQATVPLHCQVRRCLGDKYGRHAATQSLHPQAQLISGRDARVLFEHAKLIYQPEHGRIEFLQNGIIRDSFGDFS